MPTVNLGKVGMSLKGVYDNEVQYEKLDVVYYDDSTYCAKVNTQGNLPTDETYWQLLVAPNPLATWKPNTKDDEGYVQKGDGHTDSLWATDSEGNPAWVKKEDVATKVETNSKTADGIVTKGQDSPDKVWATDSEGNPAWRKLDSNFQYAIDTSKWGTPLTNGYKPIAKFTNNSETSGAKIVFEGMNNVTNDYYTETYYIYIESKGENHRYMDGGFAGVNAPYYDSPLPSGLGIFCAPYPYGTYNKNEVELCVLPNLSKYNQQIVAILFGLKYSGDLTIEWYDIEKNNWVSAPPAGAKAKEFTQFVYPEVSNSDPGLVPAIPLGRETRASRILGATYPYSAYSSAQWYTFADLSLLTSTEVDTKIAEAITEANVPQFVELDHIPTVEEAETNKFYLVKNEDTQHYDIYALLGEKVELIDDTTVDLTNYTTLTDEQYNALIELLGEE